MTLFKRFLSTTSYDQVIYFKLASHFQPSKLAVVDTSGGCGTMFSITIHSAKFNGLSLIKQHRLVNLLLKDEIKNWHGLQLVTKGEKA